ncbi:MAG: regulatory iron-sulfur-containing complex subunit RicT [Patescibacteria group bacterium]
MTELSPESNNTLKQCVSIKLRPWDKPALYDGENYNLKLDDWVLIETEHGVEAGKVVNVGKCKEENLNEPLKKIKTPADLETLKIIKDQQTDKKKTLRICKQYIRKFELPMKLVDCIYTIDNKKVVFAFTAECRVDFRELVKELINNFQKAIRLQQIGIRDELKQIHTIGPCGRETCCASFLDDLGNITTDLARLQQVQQRGSDRLSGSCGRLKCCLNYEAEGYRTCSRNLPALDSIVKTEKGEGRVIEWNVIKHSVLVRVDRENIVEKFFGCKASGCSGCKANKYKEKA